MAPHALLCLGWEERAGGWPGLPVLSCTSLLATRGPRGGAGVRRDYKGTQSWEGRQLTALIQMGRLSGAQLSLA